MYRQKVKPKQLEIGGNCFVVRPDQSFPGRVAQLRPGWVRVVGKGEHEKTVVDEWFPVRSKALTVTPA